MTYLPPQPGAPEPETPKVAQRRRTGIGALLAAIALVARGLGVVQIMAATVALATLTAIGQAVAMRSIAGRITLLPSLHRETLTTLASFGCFSWLQAISAAVFGQA
ncbi:MAG TPA: hypothetical protein VK755_15305, partial [Candidatus Acidoferrales bacterium]|nr:hypothetical protein [Candidatus Acidoferrales bacterium]